MIDEIRVSNLALIEEAQICPSCGLTVLTGETGAGKTALLNALKLLVGERAETSLIRDGSDGLSIEGRVFIDDSEPDGVVVRRSLGCDGRGRVEIDGALASVRELAMRIGSTVDLCGQHEHQRLLSVATHVELLDAWIGEAATTCLGAYREAREHYQAAAGELERIQALSEASAEELQEAQRTLARIDEVSPQAGELDDLESKLARAEHAALLVRNTEAVREAIMGDGGAADILSQAQSLLSEAASHDSSLEPSRAVLEENQLELDELARTLRSYRDSLDFNPESLDAMQQRLSQIQGLLRSFGPTMDHVEATRARALELCQCTSDYELLCAEAKRGLTQAEEELVRAADALDELRKQYAPLLASKLSEKMSELEMGGAFVSFEIERLCQERWGLAGPSHVELMFSPGANMSLRPLKKIASGGELSRVALAAKLVIGKRDTVGTIVFDEVDAGVGGATAKALARALRELSQTHQVIVVTHLPQLAVIADEHYLVTKYEGEGRPVTRISRVEAAERVAEIARMLSGDTSEQACAHAAELLDEAQTS